MKFKCEIDNIRTLKTGMKLTLAVDDEQTRELMKYIYNFMDKPITMEFIIDGEKQLERLKQITPEQRKKIYAILRDMEAYIGESVENLKEKTKASFIQTTEWEGFSLSDCNKELAADYIDYLINLCFEMGIPLSENPIEGIDDIEKYLRMCLKYKKCAICGQPGEIHHWDAIGMGRDRTKTDDCKLRKICLCRSHHTEAHTIGRETFKEKYHVYGIVWEG